MTVASPRSMPNVRNVVPSAMPVTIPGSAMGSTTRKLITSRPKNRKRATAMAVSVPRSSAMSVAPVAARSEATSASRTPPSAAARENQSRVSPRMGQV